MEAFARLYAELDATTSTHAKLAALERYYRAAEPGDAAWATYFLAGGRPRQPVPAIVLREVVVAAAGLPRWLFDECYDAVGDFAETVALVLPPPTSVSAAGLAEWMQARVLPLRGLAPDEITARLRGYIKTRSLWSEKLENEISEKYNQQISDAIAEVDRLGPPPVETMFDDVFEHKTWNIEEQEAWVMSHDRTKSPHYHH
jgi:hypothetical protein